MWPEADLPLGTVGKGLEAGALGGGHVLYHICNFIIFNNNNNNNNNNFIQL